MATNAKALTKGWIEFLKNNQIAELKSDPETGKLKYRKPVTAADLSRYLENSTDFGEDAISKAIHMVLAKKAIGKQPPKIQHTPPEQEPNKQIGGPQNQPKQLGSNVPTAPKKKYNNTDATDVDYRDVNEAIEDNPGSTLDEDDVEAVFNILSSPAPAAKPAAKAEPEVNPEEVQAKRAEELNRLKRMIRDTMTDGQRRALWRALTDA
jgi:hypothetical protein